MTSCSTTKVIPSDKVVIKIQPGVAFTPDVPGYFVPEARMLDILNKINK